MKEKNEFLDYLIYQKHYSMYTKTSYENDLDDYFAYLEKEGLDYKKI